MKTTWREKFLRYNLESDGDAGYDKWIPNDNPYGSPKNAVWSIGMRNNQGFALDTATNILYGSSHGPYSDDEINIISRGKNYGHPLVIGYAADGNYNGSSTPGGTTSYSAGARYTDCAVSGYTPPAAYSSPYCGKSSIAPVGNETTNMNTINAGSSPYQDPLFCAYPSTSSTISQIWNGTINGNGLWESEGWSGLDFYSNSMIPGWKNSLVNAGLKWGRLIRLPLDATGTKTLPSAIGGAVGNKNDTVTYFQSTNRYRDLAFGPNGKDIYLVMDNSSATSGPGVGNPVTPACAGCVIKYSFIGYNNDGSGLSTLPKSIGISSGTANNCTPANQVTIDASNNSMWVPITGLDGNIVAEINAAGQNLGLVTTSYYINTNAVRTRYGTKYANRNITITPANNSFSTPVKIRLYLTAQEFTDYKNAGGVTNISNLRIHKNNDNCSAAILANTTELAATSTATADITQGTNGYVLQTTVSSFSTFYFAARNTVLPVQLISFTAKLQSDLSGLLQWRTENQPNVVSYAIERSIDGSNFTEIGNVNALSTSALFTYTDNEAQYQNAYKVYYRLRLVDRDGSFTYSNIVTVDLPATKSMISIAPNPVSEKLTGTVNAPISGNATLSIYDNAGRLVSRTTAYLLKGENNIQQNTGNLSSGLYYLNVSGTGFTIRSKFQKM